MASKIIGNYTDVYLVRWWVVVDWAVLFSCFVAIVPVPIAAIFYFDRKLPYRDHPYREFKHFVFMYKVALIGSLFGIIVLWLLYFFTGAGGPLLAVLTAVGYNFTMAFVEVLRYPPYGVVNPLKIVEYLRYEKQQRRGAEYGSVIELLVHGFECDRGLSRS